MQATEKYLIKRLGARAWKEDQGGSQDAETMTCLWGREGTLRHRVSEVQGKACLGLAAFRWDYKCHSMDLESAQEQTIQAPGGSISSVMGD